MKKVSFVLLSALFITAFTTKSSVAESTGGVRFTVMLSGAAEVPGPGDPDGMGMAELTLNQGQGTIAYEITVQGIDPAMAAHIHRGTANMAGPVVVTLDPPMDGMVSGVEMVSPELIKDIRKNPGNYYINVHNTQFPAGAVRGQLDK